MQTDDATKSRSFVPGDLTGFNRIEQDLTGLPSTSLAWGRGWHQDKEAYGLSSALVNSNNLVWLLTPLSTTYSRLVFK